MNSGRMMVTSSSSSGLRALWRVVAAISLLPGVALGSTGLHQVVSEADAGMLARFDGLWTIGVLATLLGGLLLISSFRLP